MDLGARARGRSCSPAHHDAVPGSPGANDNAAAVGILRALGVRLVADPPRRLRVRLAFFAGEERAMLGVARLRAAEPIRGISWAW